MERATAAWTRSMAMAPRFAMPDRRRILQFWTYSCAVVAGRSTFDIHLRSPFLRSMDVVMPVKPRENNA